MQRPSYIIGLGPPRSGTTSLAALLHGCEGARVSHEGTPFAQPWPTEEQAVRQAVEWLEAQSGRYVGDVGYYWLPYVLPLWRRLAPRVVFTAVVRPEAQWHRSFSERVDPAVLQRNDSPSRKQFPTPPGTRTERRRRYYRRYVRRLQALRYEGVPLAIYGTAALNVPRRILRTSGIARPDWTPSTHHKNQRCEQ